MYNDFFGFKKKPFSLNPDPDFLYLCKTHQSVLNQLEYGLMNELGIMVVTGEIGTGKSTHIHYLIEHLEQNYTTALITNTQFSNLAEMLTNILWSFGIKRGKTDKVDRLVALLKKFLTSKYQNQKKVLLVIDEAQNLSLELLENLRLLSNFTIDDNQVLQLIIVGQEELKDKLQRPGLEQILQRISAFKELSPLDKKETHQYILHRLEVAGGIECRKIMTQSACNVIYKYSRGIPRLINLIAELVLVRSFADEISRIDSNLVEEVVEERKGGVLQFHEIVNTLDPQEEDYLEQLHANKTSANVNDKENASVYTSDQRNNRLTAKKIDTVEKTEPLISRKKETVDESINLADTSSPDQDLWKNVALDTFAKEDTEEEVIADSELNNTLAPSGTKTAGKRLLFSVIIIFFLGLLFYPSAFFKINEIESWLAQIKDISVLNEVKNLTQNTIDSMQLDRAEQKSIADKVDTEVKGKTAIPNAQPDIVDVSQADVSLSIAEKHEPDLQKVESSTINSNSTHTTKKLEKPKMEEPEFVKTPGSEVPVQQDEVSKENKSPKEKSNVLLAVAEEQKAPKSKVNVQQDKLSKNNNTPDGEINILLAIAEEQVANLKLTIPSTDCAWDTYNKILKINSKQKQALAGLKNIKDIYMFWAERELDKSNLEKAEYFFTKALVVAPSDKTVAWFLARVKKIRRSSE